MRLRSNRTRKPLTDQQRIDAQGRMLRVSFVVQALLVVLLLVMVFFSRDIRTDASVVRGETSVDKTERQVYQAENRVLICKLNVDDAQDLTAAEELVVEDLCGEYDTVDDGIISEKSRDREGRIDG